MATRMVFSGRKLMEVRVSRGLGRLRMARAVGFVVTPETIKRYEMGRTTPKLDVVTALAQALGVELAALMEISHDV